MGPTTSTYFDLSGMTGLRNYYAYSVNAVIKLANTVEVVYGEHMNYPFFETSETKLAQLKSYNNNNSSETTSEAFKILLDSLKYCQTTSEISFNFSSFYGGINFDGIGNLKDLKIGFFKFNPWYYDIPDLDGLSELNGGNGYIKNLYINGSRNVSQIEHLIEKLPDISTVRVDNLSVISLGIKNIDGLKLNSNITSLDLSYNNIQNLTALQNMKQLKNLTLNNNKIYNNCIDENTNEKVNNLDVLYNLNNSINSTNSLVFVNLKNNYLEENNVYIKVKNSFDENCLW